MKFLIILRESEPVLGLYISEGMFDDVATRMSNRMSISRTDLVP